MTSNAKVALLAILICFGVLALFTGVLPNVKQPQSPGKNFSEDPQWGNLTPGALENFSGGSSIRRNFSVDSTLTQLEYLVDVPPVRLYRRPQRIRSANRSKVHIACLYAGFMRDFERMLVSCRDVKSSSVCHVSKNRKFFGNQFNYIISGTDCDVFISTWDIRGAGRFFTSKYDMNATVSPQKIIDIYGPRLAALHMQHYAAYQPLWYSMHLNRRSFPQVRSRKLQVDPQTGASSWSGVPEVNFFLRQNDYSQSYKHWCLVQLVANYSDHYNLYFRLRTDLRVIRRFTDIRFDASIGQPKSSRSVAFRLVSDANYAGGYDEAVSWVGLRDNITHFVHDSRIHAGNFDIADFGFMGPPGMIKELATLWSRYCVARPTEQVERIGPISEYNLMLWRIIFDKGWEVDSGHRYLWVSRRALPVKGGGGRARRHK